MQFRYLHDFEFKKKIFEHCRKKMYITCYWREILGNIESEQKVADREKGRERKRKAKRREISENGRKKNRNEGKIAKRDIRN